ncbi:MAG TPA: GTP cyclohydrolase I FolE [bacterium]|jgi:GTP cyclohydrolase I|nr:GTP cyclohydrolase I FolE [bacterium]
MATKAKPRSGASKLAGRTDLKKIERAVRMILEAVGEDPDREGLRETPRRVARMYDEVFAGLKQDPKDVLKIFKDEGHEEMVLLKGIPFYSMCEHHLLPFAGYAHVCYIPSPHHLSGISKLARVVDVLSRRPQVQERLTAQIADTLIDRLKAQGVLIVLEAEHYCMTMRGVRKAGSRMVTSAVRGSLATNDISRKEALALIGTLG